MDEEIMNALKKIQEICKTKSCSVCPFGDKCGCCKISDVMPETWKLNNSDEIYRYFKD